MEIEEVGPLQWYSHALMTDSSVTSQHLNFWLLLFVCLVCCKQNKKHFHYRRARLSVSKGDLKSNPGTSNTLLSIENAYSPRHSEMYRRERNVCTCLWITHKVTANSEDAAHHKGHREWVTSAYLPIEKPNDCFTIRWWERIRMKSGKIMFMRWEVIS